jgi:acyl carrier protein
MINLPDALNWIAEVFGEPPGRITVDTPSSSIKGWDSLGTLMLIADLDEKFGIQLDEGEMYALKSVGDIIGVLERQGALLVAA